MLSYIARVHPPEIPVGSPTNTNKARTMHVLDIRKCYSLRNPDTGAVCSPYGSIPLGYAERVDYGSTFGIDTRTIGMSPSATSLASAVKRANTTNEHRRHAHLPHADTHPLTAGECHRRAERVPMFDDAGNPQFPRI